MRSVLPFIPVRAPALLAVTLALLACSVWAGEEQCVGAPARVQARARAADLRREPRLQDGHPGALHTDVGPLKLRAPSVRGRVDPGSRRVGGLGPLVPLRLAVAARAPVLARAAGRPLPVNGIADHPDLHTCPSCGPPERS